MNFWHSVQEASGMGSAFYWVALGFVVVAVALYAAVAESRRRVRGAFMLFALSFAGLLVAGLLLTAGVSAESGAYRWLRWASRFGAWLAIINLSGVLVLDVALSAVRFRPPRIMRDLLVALAYIVIALYLLSSSGVDLQGIVATSAVITAVIGFSLADTLGNVMGGMALQMESSIRVGDWVRIERTEGQVKEISWRQTSIETRDWDTVVIPNSQLMRGQVTVLGRRLGAPRQTRRWVYFNVDFRHQPTDVIAAVETALCAEPIPNVAASPAPHCLLIDFKESYGSYAARYWLTDIALTDPTDSVVRARVFVALKRAEIALSIPAQMQFVEKDTVGRRKRKRERETARRVEALRNMELFQSLTDEELRELAPRLRAAPFVRGEAMTRQGAVGHWLYVITRGEAEVRVAVDGQHSEHVASLGAGDYFGEMALMTGEPRHATVIALTDSHCYRLDKESFHDILRRRPEIAEDISHALARRRVELEAVREELDEEAKRQRMSHTQSDMLQRIRSFFKLD